MSRAKAGIAVAEQIAKLLRAGKATEVTDEMMGRADQAHLDTLYDIPLDYASRQERRSVFYPGEEYHVSRGRVPIDRFDPDKMREGLHVGSPKQASDRHSSLMRDREEYQAKNPGKLEGEIPYTTYKLAHSAKNPFRVSNDIGDWGHVDDLASEITKHMSKNGLSDAKIAKFSSALGKIQDAFHAEKITGRQAVDYIHQALMKLGFDMIEYPNNVEGVTRVGGIRIRDKHRSKIMLDPTQIRNALSARFDPRLAHLSDIRAAVPAGVATGATIYGMNQDENTPNSI